MKTPPFRLRETAVFLRLSLIGISWATPMTGMLSVNPAPSFAIMCVGAMVATCFHVCAYVLNDLIDLDLDRSVPRRQQEPLVRGAVSRAAAFSIAFAQVPILFVLTWLAGGSFECHLWTVMGLAAMFIYNLFGKRSSLPPLTDAVQGVTFASLILYGAYLAGNGPTMATWLLGLFMVVHVMLMNGFCASLRDLQTDQAGEVRSTALWLGARHLGAEGIRVPARLRRYAAVLQFGLCALSLYGTATQRSGPSGLLWVAVLALNALSSVLLFIQFRQHEKLRVMAFGALHMVLSFWSMALVVVWDASSWWITALVVAYFGPMVLSTWLPASLRAISPAPRSQRPLASAQVAGDRPGAA